MSETPMKMLRSESISERGKMKQLKTTEVYAPKLQSTAVCENGKEKIKHSERKKHMNQGAKEAIWNALQEQA